jgi:hypothetical protein
MYSVLNWNSYIVWTAKGTICCTANFGPATGQKSISNPGCRASWSEKLLRQCPDQHLSFFFKQSLHLTDRRPAEKSRLPCTPSGCSCPTRRNAVEDLKFSSSEVPSIVRTRTDSVSERSQISFKTIRFTPPKNQDQFWQNSDNLRA